jgi:N-acetyl-1-D-myo-inositol-2-amino-2-deoxy-alpha-D-glucopyranoside deacetylase
VPTLAAVVAHPDDDTFGCAGTVALHAGDPGFRFILIHVTSGEAGEIAEESGATRETLGEVREEEDRRSWVALGREPDRHEFLRLPDGGVADAPFEPLVDAVASVFRQERPDVVLTFGPDGITGHADHVRTGEAATAAFHRVRAEGGPGLARLLHQSLPASAIDAWNRALAARGMDPIDPTQPFQPRGVPDETIAVAVDCSAVADRKLAALREHRTQQGGMTRMPEEDLLRMLGSEWHVLAWPAREAGEPVRRGVFDGL